MKIFLICFITILCQFFTGCSSNTTNLIEENISDIRQIMFYGENTSFIVTFTCGQRESEYSYNGIHTENIDFGLITLYPLEKNDNYKINFTMQIDDKEITGILEKSPYSSEYLADLQHIVDENSIISITINNEKIDLSCLTKNWEINYKNAIEIASKEVDNDVIKNKECEFYLKIIHDVHISKENYFWLFSYVTKDKQQKNIIIDPSSGEIIFKN